MFEDNLQKFKCLQKLLAYILTSFIKIVGVNFKKIDLNLKPALTFVFGVYVWVCTPMKTTCSVSYR